MPRTERKHIKNIEVEVRGPLSRAEFERLDGFLKRHSKLQEIKERILIDYSTFLPREGVQNRSTDIRLRVTNRIPEIIVKLGKWGERESRTELSVTAPRGSFDTLVQVFATLGLRRGILCIRTIHTYQYRGVEFALVDMPRGYSYFEAEKMVSSSSEKKKALDAIQRVSKGLGLHLFSRQGFFRYVETLNREVNEVFDFRRYRPNYFKKRFQL